MMHYIIRKSGFYTGFHFECRIQNKTLLNEVFYFFIRFTIKAHGILYRALKISADF